MAFSKRERTRNRLLQSAQQLLLDEGVAALTVNSLSARAEMAPGSLYNYYRTLDDVLAAISELLLAGYHRELDRLTCPLVCPAQVVAASCLQTFALLQPGGDLARLLYDSGFPPEHFIQGVRQRFIADAHGGLEQGVFFVSNASVTLSMISGAIYGVLVDRHLGVLPEESAVLASAKVLELLGIAPAEAEDLARRPYDLGGPLTMPLSSLELLPTLSSVIDALAHEP
jgi:AcrR family transcriptional regulator